ncbi:hypothetical protein pEaSNUABM44_00449 [Erwinia phage pEa_SNUABM_44]|nr:hypothetical protein pEaSNUABM44_00449 [Erwinia phage pEa_SNUABM_44]
MKHYYDVLVMVVVLFGLATCLFKSIIVAFIGIAIFFLGCLVEYLINRNKT